MVRMVVGLTLLLRISLRHSTSVGDVVVIRLVVDLKLFEFGSRGRLSTVHYYSIPLFCMYILPNG